MSATAEHVLVMMGAKQLNIVRLFVYYIISISLVWMAAYLGYTL